MKQLLTGVFLCTIIMVCCKKNSSNPSTKTNPSGTTGSLYGNYSITFSVKGKQFNIQPSTCPIVFRTTNGIECYAGSQTSTGDINYGITTSLAINSWTSYDKIQVAFIDSVSNAYQFILDMPFVDSLIQFQNHVTGLKKSGCSSKNLVTYMFNKLVVKENGQDLYLPISAMVGLVETDTTKSNYNKVLEVKYLKTLQYEGKSAEGKTFKYELKQYQVHGVFQIDAVNNKGTTSTSDDFIDGKFKGEYTFDFCKFHVKYSTHFTGKGAS
jgi:hypothetical protein